MARSSTVEAAITIAHLGLHGANCPDIFPGPGPGHFSDVLRHGGVLPRNHLAGVRWFEGQVGRKKKPTPRGRSSLRGSTRGMAQPRLLGRRRTAEHRSGESCRKHASSLHAPLPVAQPQYARQCGEVGRGAAGRVARLHVDPRAFGRGTSRSRRSGQRASGSERPFYARRRSPTTPCPTAADQRRRVVAGHRRQHRLRRRQLHQRPPGRARAAGRNTVAAEQLAGLQPHAPAR